MVEFIRAKIEADEAAVRKAMLPPGDVSDVYFKLCRQQRDLASTMASLATRLRISPSSTSGYRAVLTAIPPLPIGVFLPFKFPIPNRRSTGGLQNFSSAPASANDEA